MAKQAAARAESSSGKTAVAKSASQLVSEAPQALTPRVTSHAEIAEYAYGIYLARGAGEGGDVGDWLRAEHELRAVG